MRKTWAFTFILLSSLFIVSSCAKTNQMNQHAAVESDGAYDPEPFYGDLGVESSIYANRIRSLSEKHLLLDPNGFPLIRQFPNPAIPPIHGTYVENLLQAAKSFMGTPYVFGADRMDPSSFDCSSFTRWVFLSALGIDLPWDSRSQAAYVKAFSNRIYTSLAEAHPGDLLFFTSYRGNSPADYAGLTPNEKPVSHMGIYLGDGKIIHCASKKSGGVNIHPLEWRQLTTRFLFGGGILPPPAAPTASS